MADETNPIPEQLHLGPHLPQTYGPTGETCRQRLRLTICGAGSEGMRSEGTSLYKRGETYRGKETVYTHQQSFLNRMVNK